MGRGLITFAATSPKSSAPRNKWLSDSRQSPDLRFMTLLLASRNSRIWST